MSRSGGLKRRLILHLVGGLAATLVIALTATACSHPVRSKDVARPVQVKGEEPRVNWDRPFGDGVDISSDQADDATAIQRTGRLSFTPIVPKFSVAPVLVQVTPTSLASDLRGVVFVYRFPLSPSLPQDGRVTVLEQSGLSRSDVISLTAANAKEFPGGAELITLANGVPAELKTNSGLGLGGVVMSLGSNVWVDIAGPALTPDFAHQLADTFG